MLQNSVRLFTVAGIEVGIHASWLIIFMLVTWTLAVGYFPDVIPGIEPLTAWALGVLSSLLLFASVLVHELAHSFMAKARGLDARSITLFLFGGVSNLGGEAKKPSVEFQVAIVGPITSFALAGVAWVITGLVIDEPRFAAVFGYLAVINVLLGAFNLIPGFPLDGGRVFRAIAWTMTGSLRRGTEIASMVGRIVGYGFMLIGVFLILNAFFLQGIWIAAIGWFLQGAAGASVQQVAFEQRLRNVRVGEVVRRDTTCASPNDTVTEAIASYLVRGNRRAVPVCRDGSLIGIITTSDIAKVPEDERSTTRVVDVMGGRDRVVSVTPGLRLSDALQKLAEGEFEQLPVLEDGALIGVLGRADVLRQFQLREELGLEEESVPTR
jgi:Zn-dependent protease/CBS domain-containing protein